MSIVRRCKSTRMGLMMAHRYKIIRNQQVDAIFIKISRIPIFRGSPRNATYSAHSQYYCKNAQGKLPSPFAVILIEPQAIRNLVHAHVDNQSRIVVKKDTDVLSRICREIT